MDAKLSSRVAARKAVAHLRACDARLKAVIDRVGPYKMQFRPADFRMLTRSIVFQQLNGRAAGIIFERLEQACGEVTPQKLLRLRLPRLRALGLSLRKAEYIRDLAARTHSGEIVFEDLPALSDEEIIGRLTAVRGVGVWTVHMFLMFALERPDVLPVGDYGIRQAMKRL